MIRKKSAAGYFYAADRSELLNQLHEAFEGNFGPGLPSAKKKRGSVFGAVVPHAGYALSGQAAAWVYKTIAESKKPDLFLVIGANHYAPGKTALSLSDFATPLGTAINDKEFGKQIIRLSKRRVIEDEYIHAREHSVEVQLPFLQFAAKGIKFIPIAASIQDYYSCRGIAKTIVAVSRKFRKRICVIASSDFTHYGPAYSFVPFTDNIRKNLYNLDKGAISKILSFKTKEFLDYAKKTTICGAGAIAITMKICRLLGSRKTKLLKYYTSGDVIKDYNNAVGYASIIFE